jgi:hypothetical protein
MIRSIYLYTFALLGLVLLTIGGVRFIDMGLKASIFNKAEEEERLNYRQSYYLPYPSVQIEKIENEGLELSEEDKDAVRRWIADYKEWEEKRLQIDPVAARRHREASFNLALILIGLPLYLYHWQIIKRETRKQ